MSTYRLHRPSLHTVFSTDKSLACVRVSGHMDSNSWQDLADLHHLLVHAGSARAVFDLAPTSFAGVTLMAFLARLADTGLTVVLCRPTNTAARMILATDPVGLFEVSDELTPDWIDPMDQQLAQR